MPGIIPTRRALQLPPARPDQRYVTVSPMTAGHITLPEYIFYEPSEPGSMKYVPSLAFLIQHPDAALFAEGATRAFRLIFDLGVRADPLLYVPALQKHIKSRSPIAHRPSVRDHLVSGGVAPGDIDAIAISHVHWDHHGDPQDFPNATFLLGPGALNVLKYGLPGTGNHSVFDPDLLKGLHVVELEKTLEYDGDCCSGGDSSHPQHGKKVHFRGAPSNRGSLADSTTKKPVTSKRKWMELGPFSAACDVLGDGSVYIINAPGHLYGHINLLCRTGQHNWVYLGGDTFHHTRMLTGEKRITTYADESGSGRTCCIHVDKEAAQRSLEMVRVMMDSAREADYEIECIVAHDVDWLAANQHRLFPKCL